MLIIASTNATTPMTTTAVTTASIATSSTPAHSFAPTTNVANETTSSSYNTNTTTATQPTSSHTLTTATEKPTTVHPNSTTEHTTPQPTTSETSTPTSTTPYANTTTSNHTSPFFSPSTRNMNVSTPTFHPTSSTTTEKPFHVTFDLASFFGGIILSAGLIAILYFAYKCYTKRKNGDGHFRQFQNSIDAWEQFHAAVAVSFIHFSAADEDDDGEKEGTNSTNAMSALLGLGFPCVNHNL